MLKDFSIKSLPFLVSFKSVLLLSFGSDSFEIKPSQEELIQQLNTIVTQIDTEEVFVNDALRSQLEPFQHQYEMMSELAKPIRSRPKYV